nr:adenylyl cyclase associated protein 1 [Hymenolepis microstoma]
MNSALNAPLHKFATLSADISPDVKTQCDLLIVAFKAVSDFIQSAASMSKPSDSQLPSVLNPCAAAIQKVVEYKDANRSSADFNHLAAIAESVSALGWIAMPGKPSTYIEEMSEAGKFYSNRILKDFKDKDEKRVQWVHALTDLWNQLKAYTSTNYPSGLIWGSAGSPPPPLSGGAPPPPPPPPCPEPSESSTHPTGPDTRALFAEINRGDAASRGLRKVKTQKNSEHAAGGVVPSRVKKTVAPAIPARPDQRKAVEQPKVEQIGNKWNVQYFVGNLDVVVEAKEKKETVYIYKCQDSCVKIKGKVNSIVLDSCTKTYLVFETVISTVDVINCQDVKVQVTGVMPTINIDKTDGCQVFLNEESKDVDIITAKSSEMNILVPVGDGDYTEYNVPEQFKTKLVLDHLETKVNDLS